MKTRMTALSTLALIIAGGAMAGEPRGTEVVTFPIQNYIYVSCINEIVDNSIVIELRRHDFETPSGTLIVLEHVTFTGVSVGRDSLKEWIISGPANFVNHLRKGETYKEIIEYRIRPADGGGTSMFYRGMMNMTVNANGELVVYMEPGADLFQCIGKK